MRLCDLKSSIDCLREADCEVTRKMQFAPRKKGERVREKSPKDRNLKSEKPREDFEKTSSEIVLKRYRWDERGVEREEEAEE